MDRFVCLSLVYFYFYFFYWREREPQHYGHLKKRGGRLTEWLAVGRRRLVTHTELDSVSLLLLLFIVGEADEKKKKKKKSNGRSRAESVSQTDGLIRLRLRLRLLALLALHCKRLAVVVDGPITFSFRIFLHSFSKLSFFFFCPHKALNGMTHWGPCFFALSLHCTRSREMSRGGR